MTLKMMQIHLAYHLLATVVFCGIFDLVVFLLGEVDLTVSDYVRTTWLKWPAGISIALIILNHFVGWPVKQPALPAANPPKGPGHKAELNGHHKGHTPPAHPA